MASDWLPAATLAAGIVGTLGGQGLTGWLEWKRDRGARDAQRQVAREAFQRDTLLELQDAIGVYVRSALKIHSHQEQVYRSTKQYGRQRLPLDLNEGNGEANVAVIRLRQRVLDDRLRDLVARLQDVCTEVVMPEFVAIKAGNDSDIRRAEIAKAAFIRLVDEQKELSDHLGRVLRGVL